MQPFAKLCSVMGVRAKQTNHYTDIFGGKKKMKNYRRVSAFVLAVSILLTGCSSAENGSDADSTGSSSTGTGSSSVSDNSKPDIGGQISALGATVTAEDIKKAYGTDGATEVMPLYNVSETESFTFDFNFDYYDTDIDVSLDLYDFVSIHTDSKCLEASSIYYTADITDNGDGTFTLTVGPMAPVLGTDSQDSDYVHEKIDSWGNAPMYYIALHYDTESTEPKKLDTPVVIPFTVKHEVDAPNVKGVVDEKGIFSLRWEPVEGAEKYIIYKLTEQGLSTGEDNHAIAGAENGYGSGDTPISLLRDGETTECSFSDFAGETSLAENYIEDTGCYTCSGQNFCVNGEYYVTAVVNGEESGLSNAVETSDLAIPYMMPQESEIYFTKYPTVADFPTTVDVINIDGSVTTRNVIYSDLITYDLYGYEVERYDFTVEGTALAGYVRAEETSADDKPPVAESGTESGNTKPEDEIDMIPDNEIDTIIPVDPEDTGDTTEDGLVQEQIENTQEHLEQANGDTVANAPEGVYVNADSAEEEWLALNFIDGNTEISLEAFPKLQDPNYLVDVMNKVYYQNPYVIGIKRYSYDYETFTFKVEYTYTTEEIKTMQAEMTEKANSIVSEIITEGMTDEEKIKAIYLYLEENCVYDNEALQAAEEAGFVKNYDKQYESAFNTYGILVEGEGVCMSYAYTFRMLCDMSGVEAIVLTGYLDGNLPHAWNMVKLEGEWYEIDCTNNGKTTGIPFYLYQADSETANETGYTKDKVFEIDSMVAEYVGDDSSREYYESRNLTAEDSDALKKLITDNVTDTTSIFAIRWNGESISKQDVASVINVAFNELGFESKLATTGFIVTSNFIVIVIN